MLTQQVSSKQLKRNQREAEIITATVALLKDRGFLELKMSDVAKAAGCSMGAIYSHFFSKEDLLIACTSATMQSSLADMQKLLDSTSKPLDRHFLVLFFLWHKDNANPHHYMLRQLSWNPSVWQRASDYRHAQLNTACEQFDELMKVNCHKLLAEELGSEPEEADVNDFMVSTAGLSQGTYLFKESGLGIVHSMAADDDMERKHLVSLRYMLRGWGIRRDDMDGYLKRLFEQASH
ncbi:TetR/AcrR family transcriptional regulator [Parendozoicomonas haliclonae]|uniref:HTH-type transcriptional repressor KstR2 n=1 Tax=Parendozoicomonas haliclonae TaxID=1960125 RepID=A0A1X7AGE7_9GAMM|nr:TetR/AcrR family transcriptional regulator [Parendozoicomonas haliclonae]SMA32842.1 HTH-type transcriptional repressor KstR2 [Parendozoicomonas haliclonae]